MIKFILFILLIYSYQSVWANKAGIVLFPTRAVLQESDKSVQVTLINKGGATGSYEISLVDMNMQENGKILPHEGEEHMPFSMIPFTRFSPRRVTLAPESSQKIKLLIRHKGDLPDGEYRSHLRIYLVEDNVEQAEKTALESGDSTKTSIAVKQRTAFVIPIIWRKGKTDAQFTINNVNFHKEEQGISFDALRVGNQSDIGEFSVTYIPEGREPRLIAQLGGVAIYHPTPKRHVRIKLDDGVALPLKKGKIIITYVKQKEQGGGLLAEYEQLIP